MLDLPRTTEESPVGEVAAVENFPAAEKVDPSRPERGRPRKAPKEPLRPNVEVIRVHNCRARVGDLLGEELLQHREEEELQRPEEGAGAEPQCSWGYPNQDLAVLRENFLSCDITLSLVSKKLFLNFMYQIKAFKKCKFLLFLKKMLEVIHFRYCLPGS